MKKEEIFKIIEKYNNIMLKLKLEEKLNALEKNFDIQNARAEAISTARECETEEITKTLKKYLSNNGVVAIGYNLLEDCDLADLLYAFNSIKEGILC